MRKYFVLIAFVSSTLLGGYTIGSGIIIHENEFNISSRISTIYDNFDGYKPTEVQVEEGEPLIITVSITTEEGIIDAYISKSGDDENLIYEEHDIPTATFDVALSEPGEYTLRFKIKKHSGSYSFSW